MTRFCLEVVLRVWTSTCQCTRRTPLTAFILEFHPLPSQLPHTHRLRHQLCRKDVLRTLLSPLTFTDSLFITQILATVATTDEMNDDIDNDVGTSSYAQQHTSIHDKRPDTIRDTRHNTVQVHDCVQWSAGTADYTKAASRGGTEGSANPS